MAEGVGRSGLIPSGRCPRNHFLSLRRSSEGAARPMKVRIMNEKVRIVQLHVRMCGTHVQTHTHISVTRYL